jgi:hypothetical protein
MGMITDLDSIKEHGIVRGGDSPAM